MSAAKTVRKAEDIAADWNHRHPIGTPVLYWPGFRKGPGNASRTRTPAWVLCGNPVVSVDDYPGGIALTHVDPAPLWGVEFAGSPTPDHVTVSASEDAARRFLRGLKFCGNTDACLVVDDGHGWYPAEAVTQ